MKKLSIFSVKTDCGASKHGADFGADAIKNNGLQQAIQNGDFSAEEIVITSQPNDYSEFNLNNCGMVVDVNRRLYYAVKSAVVGGSFPLALGGDHSIAAGSVAAVSATHKNIGVVWIDAHGDWNDNHSTETGNMHGMSFSAACGHGPDCMARFDDDFSPVNPHKCVLIGARDLDKQEAVRIRTAGVTVFTADDVRALGVQAVVQNALDVILNGTCGFHLSFDVDCVDPSEAPGTGTLAKNGLTASQAKQLVVGLAQSGKMLSLDVVEVNPLLDVDNKTSVFAAQIAEQLLKFVK